MQQDAEIQYCNGVKQILYQPVLILEALFQVELNISVEVYSMSFHGKQC
jgi:hypothetical protein